MCELVLNMRAPKSSWRTLSEVYTLLKLEYHHTVPGGPYSHPICTEQDFQARWKELVARVELDPPVATVLRKAVHSTKKRKRTRGLLDELHVVVGEKQRKGRAITTPRKRGCVHRDQDAQVGGHHGGPCTQQGAPNCAEGGSF